MHLVAATWLCLPPGITVTTLSGSAGMVHSGVDADPNEVRAYDQRQRRDGGTGGSSGELGVTGQDDATRVRSWNRRFHLEAAKLCRKGHTQLTCRPPMLAHRGSKPGGGVPTMWYSSTRVSGATNMMTSQ